MNLAISSPRYEPEALAILAAKKGGKYVHAPTANSPLFNTGISFVSNEHSESECDHLSKVFKSVEPSR